ncbi:hypothetical protein [Synoicihabitans lomoniglobus]|uniref:Lipoprotein n=1 Tax=Synoicihabitans lomoniglobus TaxID=2909285 RepID=A0AAE9ZXN3_9BACT|nr:hypothetical protein [Opitutaceae bacterium LMO-M01]WED65184.1 hypothetical protein PXH66_22835 [Opitutaceae bacterium LMO-M01]
MKTNRLILSAFSVVALGLSTGCGTYTSSPTHSMTFTSSTASLHVRPAAFDTALNTTIRLQSVDDRRVGQAAAPAVPLEPGRHTVKIFLDGSDHQAVHTLTIDAEASHAYRIDGQQVGLDFKVTVWDETAGHGRDQRVLVSESLVVSQPRGQYWPSDIKQTPLMTGEMR